MMPILLTAFVAAVAYGTGWWIHRSEVKRISPSPHAGADRTTTPDFLFHLEIR